MSKRNDSFDSRPLLGIRTIRESADADPFDASASPHYEISFMAHARFFEKLAHLTWLLSEDGDDPPMEEVIEAALDRLIGKRSMS